MNTQIIRQLFASIVCMLFLAACTDEPFAEEDSSSPIKLENGVRISGKETEVRLPVAVADIAHIEVSEDFAMPLTDSLYLRLYMEENAEEAPRTVELRLTMNDGSHQTLRYSQGTRAAEGKSTMNDFSRTYGVGFSYDAIHGNCDLHDIKCQILNLKRLKKLEEETSEQLLYTDYKRELLTSVESSRSFAEYIQNTALKVVVSGDALVVKGKYMKEASIIEQGFRNSIYTKASLEKPVVRTWLDYPSLTELLKGKPDSPVLTRSFRNAIKRLEQKHTIEDVDNFIEKFGSFIIISSRLGGELELAYKTSYDKFRTYQQEKKLSEVEVLSFFKSRSDSQFSQEDLKILATSNCALNVKGGDASLLNNAMLNPSFDNPNININQYYAWANSLCYDELNPLNNNVEITQMEATPIWDLINNPAVAEIVKNRIEGTAKEMTEVFGYLNFVTTSFPLYKMRRLYSLLGGSRGYFFRPAMVNIIANNRYVASVCTEWVPEISTSYPVVVAYPIYEQQLELTSGLCIEKGIVYQVAWKYGQFEVKEIGRISDQTIYPRIYMNNGLLQATPTKGADNLQAYPVIGYEWPESILSDGTLNPKSNYYTVFKVFDKFYLDLPETNLNALPNWHFTNSVPNWSERYTNFIKEKGDRFFDSTGGLGVKYTEGKKIDNLKNRMIRNDNYCYYWNKLELQLK